MTEALLASQVLLWLLVVALAAVVFALMRQIGVLHERIAPAGALMGAEEPTVGQHAPVFELKDWAGQERKIGGIAGNRARTLLLFVSPSCPVCKEVLPTARSLRDAERGELHLILAGDGPRAEHESFVASHGLGEEAFVLSTELGRAYQVSKLPHAVLLDADGVVRARGLVNSREHLESLIVADKSGVSSVQEYLARRDAAADATSVATEDRVGTGGP